MTKLSFLPNKPIISPLPGELLVSYGDRLLWHQLGLQLTGRGRDMLTHEEYVRTVVGFYPDANPDNVEAYPSYFNGKHESMGLRRGEQFADHERQLPVTVELPK